MNPKAGPPRRPTESGWGAGWPKPPDAPAQPGPKATVSRILFTALARRVQPFLWDPAHAGPQAAYPADGGVRRPGATGSRPDAGREAGVSPGPIWPCTGWGLPSRPRYRGRWCALTAPFHPYPAACRHASGRFAFCCTCRPLRALALPGILPCGVRTFLCGRRVSPGVAAAAFVILRGPCTTDVPCWAGNMGGMRRASADQRPASLRIAFHCGGVTG